MESARPNLLPTSPTPYGTPTPPVDLVIWAAPGDQQAITDLYARAARMILTNREVGQDMELAAQQFLTWLGTTERTWLVVLDDVTAPRDLNGLWPPRTSTGAHPGHHPIARRHLDDGLPHSHPHWRVHRRAVAGISTASARP
ncbi:hypothetical protein [Streptomyces sp. NPDC001020]